MSTHNAFCPYGRQQQQNKKLLEGTRYMRDQVVSSIPPLALNPADAAPLPPNFSTLFEALQIETARTAIQAVASLSTINEVDHMGGGLDMVPPLLMTLAAVNHEAIDFTIENAHTSVGYYAALASLGYLDREYVIHAFRRGLDIPGHVSWVPGGTQLNGGRLGVMIPTAVGTALGKRAVYGDAAWMLCHCGDAGWIAGHALNGFNAAHFHRAPITFVMHRNGIQLSGTTRTVMDIDPRPIIQSLGIEILEIPDLYTPATIWKAYVEAYALARSGKPSLIYPVGSASMTLADVGDKFGIGRELAAFAALHNVEMSTAVSVPGCLMSFRDLPSMMECLFFVNRLPGGKGHHDGHMKGRDLDALLANPMLQFTDEQAGALDLWRAEKPVEVVTKARPPKGTPNLVVPEEDLLKAELPAPGKWVSPRNGVAEAYGMVAKAFPDNMFVIDCDLAPSTKVDKAKAALAPSHIFELSIEEQIATFMANGLAMASDKPALNVFATFSAFFEGIAREGFEMWRYQRNLNGANEGLNVTFHLSHVGSCTGRDHFSGWSLDWINLAIGYLPYLDRFYAPADARSAFVAIRDLASRYGGHIIGIPRDNLPILTKADGTPLWEASSPWEAITAMRTHPTAQKAVLAFGATAFIAAEVADKLNDSTDPVDAYVVSSLPLPESELKALLEKYRGGIVTIEDGLIGSPHEGVRGFAGLIRSAAYGSGIPMAHLGITDPRVAPSEGHLELWDYFGINVDSAMAALAQLGSEG